ncbi:hypothetical protein [Catenuloplanes indicus]|uniref:Uncharacterized protein n=1 Tax=Catenuloplanes indicus TaxID=137267 RepID=A0AAE3WAF1_9ACTN|nr:hypothetical protein [Catenuloplanes indicus]MDQ0371594.1 hypothetical protein [Catenuloplanes indicus]
MFLEDLITALAAEDRNKPVKHGFGSPHSYRGFYEQLAFEPIENTTVGAMLDAACEALDATYEGYKGGTYRMDSLTECWLAEYGSTGEQLGPTLLRGMLADGA